MKFQDLKNLQTEFVNLSKIFDRELAIFEIDLKKHLTHVKQEFESKYPNIKLELLDILQCGCRCEDWDPHITFYFWYNNTFHYLDEKIGWFYSDAYEATIFNFKKSQFPFSLDEIETLKNKLQYDDIEARPYIKKIKSSVDRLTSFNDIQLFLGQTTKLIQSNKVWYTGWDIADEWFIVENNSKYYIFWSTNGHGFGMDNFYPVLDEENKIVLNKYKNLESLNKFFNWLKSETKSSYIEEQYRDLILLSWKDAYELEQKSIVVDTDPTEE